jgi:protein transport protein SEC23
MLFVGGPCTEGAGKVINRELSEEIRSHKDLAKDGAPHFRKAKKYYDGLAQELVAHGHIMDIFACALDQVCVVGGGGRCGCLCVCVGGVGVGVCVCVGGGG